MMILLNNQLKIIAWDIFFCLLIVCFGNRDIEILNKLDLIIGVYITLVFGGIQGHLTYLMLRQIWTS